MELLKNEIYQNDIELIASSFRDMEKLKGKSVFISGSTGLIGRFLIDVIMKMNEKYDLDCLIIATGRSKEKASEKFSAYFNNNKFMFVECDINTPIELGENCRLDYIIHLASNTHPIAYATDPIGTVTANIIGTNNLLQLAAKHNINRFLFASSVEVYGENRGDTEYFDEKYCGYIDPNTLRAGYPESKRAGEALCQAYRKKYGLEVVIPRLARTYGPTLLKDDSKALSQFIKNGIDHRNIVLKSEGSQLYSYTYVADAVSGILCCLLYGVDGEAYNIADKRSDITLRMLAEMISEYSGTQVVFEIPNATEAAGFSKATKALLDGKKLRDTGWRAAFDIKSGIEHTLQILEAVK